MPQKQRFPAPKIKRGHFAPRHDSAVTISACVTQQAKALAIGRFHLARGACGPGMRPPCVAGIAIHFCQNWSRLSAIQPYM
ncbi:MAG: hypothetical protein Q9M41_10970 [Paracoccaceae bacterium]|nr:hypothetical protein [Paracoccaceae bacterium]